VGFRTPSGQITTVQSFKTIQIPRLVRGKPDAWDPLVCLEWGHMFLTFLKNIVREHNTDPDPRVWRVKFIPRVGVKVSLLDKSGVEEVEAGESRVGFLPKWYWDELEKGIASPVGQGTRSSIDAIPPGWQI
jgi:RAT1-interacting protein